ncbi:MAG: RibD family protein [Anaerolineae bacterium]|nr:RibD family protein [Anaerolineae bacterium]
MHPTLSPFTPLFDDDTTDGAALAPEFQAVYGSGWRIPLAHPTRPYTFMNFATSRDGRVSFNLPGQSSGGDISDFNPHDQWLMGLLRARCDAVLMGDGTMRVVPDHLWTAEFIYPPDAEAFAALRRAEGRAPAPLQVFLTLHGDLLAEAVVFDQPDFHIVIATTHHGAAAARPFQARPARVDILDLGEEGVDLPRLMTILLNEYGVQSLLVEGGPRVYGALLAAGLVDDEFVTFCPIVVGMAPAAAPRPSLVEGVAFRPENAPRSRLLSLRRAGNHLFLRSRYSTL